jgi:hypothetical protein
MAWAQDAEGREGREFGCLFIRWTSADNVASPPMGTSPRRRAELPCATTGRFQLRGDSAGFDETFIEHPKDERHPR